MLGFILKTDRIRFWVSRNAMPLLSITVPLFVWHVYSYQRLIPLSNRYLSPS
jgi:hypothetical protein